MNRQYTGLLSSMWLTSRIVSWLRSFCSPRGDCLTFSRRCFLATIAASSLCCFADTHSRYSIETLVYRDLLNRAFLSPITIHRVLQIDLMSFSKQNPNSNELVLSNLSAALLGTSKYPCKATGLLTHNKVSMSGMYIVKARKQHTMKRQGIKHAGLQYAKRTQTKTRD